MRTTRDERERRQPSRSPSRPRLTGPRWTEANPRERRRQEELHETFHPRRERENEQWEYQGWYQQTYQQQWHRPLNRHNMHTVHKACPLVLLHNTGRTIQEHSIVIHDQNGPVIRLADQEDTIHTFDESNFKQKGRHYDRTISSHTMQAEAYLDISRMHGRDVHMSCKAGLICTKIWQLSLLLGVCFDMKKICVCFDVTFAGSPVHVYAILFVYNIPSKHNVWLKYYSLRSRDIR